ncbi:hypothetical protein A0256_16060 [Mucilaginibacter sp. PAMC 26640]|nr:hypothetical protein A0256_16060 [Mucilaginibacter sp. PAMC 26640]
MQSKTATAIHSTDEMIIEMANDSMIAIWGKDRSIIGKPIEDALPELKGQPFLKMLQSVLHTGQTISGSDTMAELVVAGELRQFYFDFEYKAIKDDRGMVMCVLHTALDVTERYLSRLREKELNSELKAINEELAAANEELVSTNDELGEYQHTLLQLNDNLAASETELQFAIDAASLGTWDLDPATYRFSGNERLKSWFGLKADQEIELSKATDIIAESDRERIIEAISYAMNPASRGVYDVEFTIINPQTGLPRIVKAKGRALFDPDGKPVRFSGTLQDITEERKAQEELNETNQRLNIALDAGKLGSYDIELDSGHIICTDQFKLNYGQPINKPFNFTGLMQAVNPDYRSYLQQQLEIAIANHSIYNAEYQITWPDGSLHWVSASGTPRYDENANAIRMVGVTYDITERRQLEQRKDDFISIASHELKTPVTSLKASLQLLDRMKENPTAPIFTRLIEQSNRSMEKITSLIEDLLNVSRMNEGQLQLNRSVFNVGDLLKSCCDHVRVTGKHELVFHGDPNTMVYADEHRIDQVVVNLVNNAVKYAPNSREIYFHVSTEGKMAKISVTDGGPGISPEKLSQLFNRYYQANSQGFQNSGLGLGLYISSEIVNRHGGQIGVESELGKGSTFWFTIPLQPNANLK